ncbi:MAG: hypothetical protein AAFX06_31975 [Planctomycetota bacterium]
MRKFFTNKKGQGLLEYALILAGVSLICLVAITMVGHKTNDLLAATATILPGAHEDGNSSLFSGRLIETTGGGVNDTTLDLTAISNNKGTARLGNRAGFSGTFDGLISD